MKKLFFVAVSLILTSSVFAQKEEGMPRNTFWFNPTQMFRSELNIGLEQNFGKNKTQSIGINGGFIVRGYANQTTLGGSATVQWRNYFTLSNTVGKKDGKHSFALFYMSPYGSFRYVEDMNNSIFIGYDIYGYPIYGEEKVYINTYGIGILFGLKFIVSEKFSFDFYFGGGAQYSVLSIDDTSGTYTSIFDFGYTGILPKAGIQFGMNF